MKEISVLVGDAQPLFSSALRVAMRGVAGLHPFPDSPECWPEAVAAVAQVRPDVAVLDYWLPSAGLQNPALQTARGQALGEVQSISPQSKVLLTSWSHAAGDIRAALAAGAVGFLPKSVGLDELYHAVEQAHKGEPLVYSERLHKLHANIEHKTRQNELIAEKLATLTPAEMQVVMMLSQGLSGNTVAQRLFLSRASINARIHRILVKTQARSQAEVLAMARSAGLLKT